MPSTDRYDMEVTSPKMFKAAAYMPGTIAPAWGSWGLDAKALPPCEVLTAKRIRGSDIKASPIKKVDSAEKEDSMCISDAEDANHNNTNACDGTDPKVKKIDEKNKMPDNNNLLNWFILMESSEIFSSCFF